MRLNWNVTNWNVSNSCDIRWIMEHVVGFTHTYDAIRTPKTLSGHCLLVQSPDVGGWNTHIHQSVSQQSVYSQPANCFPSRQNVN